MTIKIQWEDALGQKKTGVAEEVKDIGKGYWLVTWVGGGTSHFGPQDNLRKV
mgnify:CR=1 FL=1